MDIKVVYFSQTGNTRKVAEVMATTFGHLGHSVQTLPIKKASPKDITRCDLLGIGSPCFTGQAPTPIKNFLRSLPPLYNQPAFVFATSGGAPGKVLYDLTSLLRRKGAEVIGGTLIRGECFHPAPCFIHRYPGRPNSEDLKRARRFALNIAEHVSMGKNGLVARSRFDAFHKGWKLYDLEGMFTPDPLVRLVMPKPKLDPAKRNKCNKCKWCIYKCPMNNITLKSFPIIGSKCIRCYRCLTGCPEKAFNANFLLGNLILLSLHNTIFERRFGDLYYDEEMYHEADKPTANWNLKKLIRVLQGKGSERAKVAAARTLGDLGDKRAISSLFLALRDKRATVREAAAQALGRISDERAIKPLISSLQDRDKYVRLEATRAMGIISYKELLEGHSSVSRTVKESAAFEGLTQASRDKHWLVRSAADKALSKL